MTLAIANGEWMILLALLVQVLWVFAFGACVGSLLNVLVYRLPLGLDVVSPSSRCPNCETKLTWRENIPILGWLMLRGKCRFCRSAISPEYPIVEAFTALLWSVVFIVLYADGGRFLGINVGVLRPEWADNGFRNTWPMFIVIVTLFSCLIAVTIIDARTFHIPMSLLIVPVVVALVAHPAHALWIEYGTHLGRLGRVASGWDWTIATPGPAGWWFIGGSIGGTIGLVLANILLAKGVIRRSFADYDEWAKAEQSRIASESAETAPPTAQDATGMVSRGPEVAPTIPNADSPELWTQYPHARREMIRELIFLAPCIGLALVGADVAHRLAGPWTFSPVTFQGVPTTLAPLWLQALSGVLLGYIIGGGVVWAIRIFGSLAFGKEAMGLGDVHLMAAVGACLGWIDSVLGFFGAAFVGVGWALLGRVFSGVFKRHMPFGPYLAIATVLVWFGKPAIEQALTMLAKARLAIDLP